MKKMFLVGLAAITFAIYSCGGDDGSVATADNPNDAASEFSSPTGTLSDSNSQDVATASVEATNSNGFTASASTLRKSASTALIDPRYFPSQYALTGSDIEACTSNSGSTFTVDWGCIGDRDDKCDGSGTTTTTVNTDKEFTTVEYRGFSYNCTGKADLAFTCNGSSISSNRAANLGISCSNLTCTFKDRTLNSKGCINLKNEFLIKVKEKSFVVGEIETDLDCKNVTLVVKFKSGEASVSCAVKKATQSCSTLSDVQELGPCVITAK